MVGSRDVKEHGFPTTHLSLIPMTGNYWRHVNMKVFKNLLLASIEMGLMFVCIEVREFT